MYVAEHTHTHTHTHVHTGTLKFLVFFFRVTRGWAWSQKRAFEDVFSYGPYTMPTVQPTVSKHRRKNCSACYTWVNTLKRPLSVLCRWGEAPANGRCSKSSGSSEVQWVHYSKWGPDCQASVRQRESTAGTLRIWFNSDSSNNRLWPLQRSGCVGQQPKMRIGGFHCCKWKQHCGWPATPWLHTFKNYLNLVLCSCGVMVKPLACDSRAREFNSRPSCSQVMTLGKLFTHMCLCH